MKNKEQEIKIEKPEDVNPIKESTTSLWYVSEEAAKAICEKYSTVDLGGLSEWYCDEYIAGASH